MDKMRIAPAGGTWVVRAGGAVVAETDAALKLEENGHDPVIYFPRREIAMAFLEPSSTTSRCPHKGEATYFSLQTKSVLVPDVAWSYESPLEEAEAIRGHLAFYPDKVTVEEI